MGKRTCKNTLITKELELAFSNLGTMSLDKLNTLQGLNHFLSDGTQVKEVNLGRVYLVLKTFKSTSKSLLKLLVKNGESEYAVVYSPELFNWSPNTETRLNQLQGGDLNNLIELLSAINN